MRLELELNLADWVGLEIDGLGGSAGAGRGGRGQEFCDWNLFFRGWVLQLETDLNLVFVTGTWFWVGSSFKLTV